MSSFLHAQKNFPQNFVTRKVYIRVQNSQSFVSILGHINPLHTPSNVIRVKTYFNIILQSTRWFC
jgi:hypothetical protein